MRILFVSSEIYPLAKTGGLADVSYALPVALRRLGVDVRLLMPAYPVALERIERRRAPLSLGAVMGFDDVGIIPGNLPGSELPVGLVDCPPLFDRQGGLYADRDGRDWPDNFQRYALLCHAGARLAAGHGPIDWQPDVVHANDWHTGLLPLLSHQAGDGGAPTLFSIHNMAFQGVFGMDVAERVGIGPDYLNPDGAEFYGKVSFLKAGIRFARQLVTVSPSYAREITTGEFGWGLEGLLSARVGDLEGILNGVDYGTWDPAHDPLLPARYTAADLSGKRACKAAIQAELGLEVDPDRPLFVYVSRLTEQKMADQVLAAAPAIARELGQFAFVAQGERRFEEGFAALASAAPGRIAGRIGYDEATAHRLIAGSDMLLAPARFEPCGLTQLYALRYGSIPIVRPTGGLADTIVHADPAALAERTATGFHAAAGHADDLLRTAARATTLWREPLTWRRLAETAMAQDFSWNRSARRYLQLYRTMAGTDGADGEDGEEEQTLKLGS
ncbi:MAG: glycogen synthase GlgA [Alphaproteobacteria bacterium]|nr:glycogen synthase GlgA [Alphaproteobacteria bacterium]